MQRLKIALPRDLRTRLDTASAKSGRSVAEEIRSRVEASFAQEASGQPTSDLIQGIAGMAAEIERECGAAWDRHAGAHAALTQAILSRLESLKPKGSTAFGDRPHATVSGDDPNQLGSMIEFRLRRQPDFTSSGMRQLLEEEYQRSVDRTMGSQRVLLDTPQQQREPNQ
jgi:hypothetical protein